MANLAVSDITITGPKDELKKVAEFLKSDEFEFDLRKITKTPSTSFYDGEEPSVTLTEERYEVNTATRWIAPIDEMKELSRKFPELTIEMEIKHYDEDIMEFFTYKNGETIYERQAEMRYDEENQEYYEVEGEDNWDEEEDEEEGKEDM
jgi:hypothetical protein